MANEQNLIPFNTLSADRHRELSQRGWQGKRSRPEGEAEAYRGGEGSTSRKSRALQG